MPCACLNKQDIKSTLKESLLILIYEMIGSMMLAAMVCNYYYQIIQAPTPLQTFGNGGLAGLGGLHYTAT